MLDALGAHARLYMAYADGAAIAGAIAAQYGNKTWYLYGASANVHRDKMPNYLLQWRMIEWALEAGCDVYDFRGVAAEQPADPALAGLWRFKSGWGAAHVTFVGEYELVVRPAANAVVRRALPVMRAAALLRAGQSRVSEVCYQVGFSTPSYFTKCFYRQFGLLPKDFIR